MTQPWLLYVLRCADGALYAGVTPNLERRLAAHRAGRGARYTRGRAPLELLRVWQYADVGAALRAERRFKQLRRASKLKLLADDGPCGRHKPGAGAGLETRPDDRDQAKRSRASAQTLVVHRPSALVDPADRRHN